MYTLVNVNTCPAITSIAGRTWERCFMTCFTIAFISAAARAHVAAVSVCAFGVYITIIFAFGAFILVEAIRRFTFESGIADAIVPTVSIDAS